MKLTDLAALTLMLSNKELDKPIYRYICLKPSTMQKLCQACVNDDRPSDMYAGLEIYQKSNQIADSWLFTEKDTLNKYLDGVLSELDLFERINSGKVKPIE